MFNPNKLEFSKIIFSFLPRVSNLHLQIVFQHFVISLSVITKLTKIFKVIALCKNFTDRFNEPWYICLKFILSSSRPVLRTPETENFSKHSQCSILDKHFRFMSSQQWTFHERRYFILILNQLFI